MVYKGEIVAFGFNAGRDIFPFFFNFIHGLLLLKFSVQGGEGHVCGKWKKLH